MPTFHAVLRVKTIRVSDLNPDSFSRTMRPTDVVLVPLWTTVADHDGTGHGASGAECSLGICDLGAQDSRAAIENWTARRAFFPFLADVRDQSVPRETRTGTIVDNVRARLTRLLAALTTAGSVKTPVVELATDDVRSLRQLVRAEMERLGDVVAEAAAEPAPEVSADAAFETTFVLPDSLLERVANALGVTATEEAALHEIHRLHQALADQHASAVKALADSEKEHATTLDDVHSTLVAQGAHILKLDGAASSVEKFGSIMDGIRDLGERARDAAADRDPLEELATLSEARWFREIAGALGIPADAGVVGTIDAELATAHDEAKRSDDALRSLCRTASEAFNCGPHLLTVAESITHAGEVVRDVYRCLGDIEGVEDADDIVIRKSRDALASVADQTGERPPEPLSGATLAADPRDVHADLETFVAKAYEAVFDPDAPHIDHQAPPPLGWLQTIEDTLVENGASYPSGTRGAPPHMFQSILAAIHNLGARARDAEDARNEPADDGDDPFASSTRSREQRSEDAMLSEDFMEGLLDRTSKLVADIVTGRDP